MTDPAFAAIRGDRPADFAWEPPYRPTPPQPTVLRAGVACGRFPTHPDHGREILTAATWRQLAAAERKWRCPAPGCHATAFGERPAREHQPTRRPVPAETTRTAP